MDKTQDTDIHQQCFCLFS